MSRNRVLSLLVGLLAAGCSDATAPSPVGSYQLTQVAGVALPAPLPVGVNGAPATVTSGTLSIRDRNEWVAEIGISVLVQGSAIPNNQIMSGTYRVSRDTVYFTDPSDNSVTPAVRAGNRLTVEVEGVSLVFDRK